MFSSLERKLIETWQKGERAIINIHKSSQAKEKRNWNHFQSLSPNSTRSLSLAPLHSNPRRRSPAPTAPRNKQRNRNKAAPSHLGWPTSSPDSTSRRENLTIKAEEKQTHMHTHTALLLHALSILLIFYMHLISGDLHSGQKLMLAGEESTLEKRGEGKKTPTFSWLVISRLDAFCGTRPKC